MKSIKVIILFIFIIISYTSFSFNDPSDQVEIITTHTITIVPNGSGDIEVTLKIPKEYYIFLEHLSDDGAGILTSFSLRNNQGINLTDIKKPEGTKQKKERVLAGEGLFTLTLADTKGLSPGTEVNAKLEITIQLCSKDKGLCYMPRTFTKEIVLKISDLSWTAADYEKQTYKTFALLPEAHKRIDFTAINYPLLHAAIFFETNRQRALQNKNVFSHSPALEKAAKGHSDDMVTYDFFGHTSPVKGKKTMTDRLALVGISTGTRGENVAFTFGIEYKAGKSVYSPDQNGGYFSYSFKGTPIKNHTYLGFAKVVLAEWMASPGHKANILDSKFTYLGTGAAHYNNPGFHNMDNFKCTQNFASVKGPVEDK